MRATLSDVSARLSTRTLLILCPVVVAACAELLLSGFGEELPTIAIGARIFAVALALYSVLRFAESSSQLFQDRVRDVVTFSAVAILSFAIAAITRVIGLSLASYATPRWSTFAISAASIDFLVPYAIGPMLLQLLIGFQAALFFAVIQAVVVAIYFPNPGIIIPLVFATNIVGALSLETCRSRSGYMLAGAKVALMGVPFVIASLLIDINAPALEIPIRLLATIIGAFVAAIVVAGLTPIFEASGGYVTDIRLLEMATLDHPLLKELSVQAPGTWNHSMVMGMMVEAAASAIGAKPILSRVSCYFHDVGKVKKPLYFVENQEPGDNRHDKLSPSMSALIIRSHVKDGIELGRKHGLPQAIIDMVPQHHGTSLIEFFYEKACSEVEDPATVDATLYSYPGPKPQTREAGLIMLADGIEAATRTLSDPTFDRIQGVVQKMINKVFASGQLDECDLTLKDLHAIAKSFTRTLSGIHHQRISYADPVEKTNPDEAAAEQATVDHTHQPGNESEEGQARGSKEGAPEDLKRLGI